MASRQRDVPEWKEFEQLVARIEKDAGPLGLLVRSPDKILCKITGRKREVDVSIRSRAGTTDLLITIECRRRHPKQDVTWIEQLATKRDAIGASCMIAVSSSGFTPNAEAVANRYGIQLRRLSEVSVSEINTLMRLDFVLFNHKRAAPTRVALRFFREEPWTVPNPEQVDMELASTTDLFAPIFRNTETDYTWSLNDMWHQVQQVGNPFADVQNGQPPVIRTACFPYSGNVSVETPDGPKHLDCCNCWDSARNDGTLGTDSGPLGALESRQAFRACALLGPRTLAAHKSQPTSLHVQENARSTKLLALIEANQSSAQSETSLQKREADL